MQPVTVSGHSRVNNEIEQRFSNLCITIYPEARHRQTIAGCAHNECVKDDFIQPQNAIHIVFNLFRAFRDRIQRIEQLLQRCFQMCKLGEIAAERSLSLAPGQ